MRQLFLQCMVDTIEQMLPLVNQGGYGLELTSFLDPNLVDRHEELIARHRLALTGFAGPRTVHGAMYNLIPGAIDPLIREATATRMRQGIDAARALEASHIIFHHGYYARSRFDDGWLARSITFWREMLDYAPAGLTIHLENAHEVSPDLQLALVREIDDPRLGLCLDIGHAHAFSEMSVTGWITALRERITYVHLHDNDSNSDQHLPLGQGTIPMVDVLTTLEEHAQQAIWMIETDVVPSLAWLADNFTSVIA